MNSKITFSLNRSSASEIASHLLLVDTDFEPTLSSRVNIQTYAQKLQCRAIRFEAWMGEVLVGLVASYCNQLDRGKAFVTSVSVWPKYKGQGIAVQLMRQCIEHARNLGFGQIELEVDQRSLPAIALYKKLGFNKMCSSDSTLTMRMTLER